VGGGGIGEAVVLGEGVATGGKAVPVPEHADAMSAARARRIEARAVQADAALGFLEATGPTPNEPALNGRCT